MTLTATYNNKLERIPNKTANFKGIDKPEVLRLIGFYKWAETHDYFSDVKIYIDRQLLLI